MLHDDELIRYLLLIIIIITGILENLDDGKVYSLYSLYSLRVGNFVHTDHIMSSIANLVDFLSKTALHGDYAIYLYLVGTCGLGKPGIRCGVYRAPLTPLDNIRI